MGDIFQISCLPPKRRCPNDITSKGFIMWIFVLGTLLINWQKNPSRSSWTDLFLLEIGVISRSNNGVTELPNNRCLLALHIYR